MVVGVPVKIPVMVGNAREEYYTQGRGVFSALAFFGVLPSSWIGSRALSEGIWCSLTFARNRTISWVLLS